MNKMNEKNQLIMAEHDEKGIWYFTSSIKAMTFCEVSYAAFYMAIKGATKQTKGWRFKIVEDNGDIPREWIDPQDWINE